MKCILLPILFINYPADYRKIENGDMIITFSIQAIPHRYFLFVPTNRAWLSYHLRSIKRDRPVFIIVCKFSLLGLGLSANAHSSLKDKSYIVTKTNDTICGKIKVNILIGGLKLITADSSYIIDPNNYSAYYNAKKKATYRSKVLPGFLPEKLAKKMSIPEKADWLKCIEDGEIKLYEYKKSNFGHNVDNVLDVTCTISLVIGTGGVIPNMEFTNWYVEKDGTQLTPIIYNSFTVAGSKPRKERKELLRNLLADNDKATQSYGQTKAFTFKAVKTLIQEYNISKS